MFPATAGQLASISGTVDTCPPENFRIVNVIDIAMRLTAEQEPTLEIAYFDYSGALGQGILRAVKVIWHEPWMVICVVCLSVLVGLKTAIFTPPTYGAKPILTPRTQNSSGSLAGMPSSQLVGLSPIVGGHSSSSLRVLQFELSSRKLIYGLMSHDDNAKTLFPRYWNDKTKSWQTIRPSIL